MRHLKKLPLLLMLVLISCNKGQNKDTNDPISASTTGIAQQPPVFTPSELPYPFSSAVQVGDILFLSGEIGATADGAAVVPGGIEAETQQMFKRIEATLAQHGLGFEDVFKCTVMLADMSEWHEFNEIYEGYFKAGQYPARSAMGVNGLAIGARVEMECWAYKPLLSKASTNSK